MVNLVKNIPQVPVVLASLVLWVPFAWGLPGEGGIAASEAVSAPAPTDPWAGVRLSDAYDYARCPQCGKKNELRAASCARCGYELPQPSAEMTDPEMVFVPGKGYYAEGTLLEPGKTRKGLWLTGLVLSASAAGALLIIEIGEASHWWQQVPEIVYTPVAGALIGAAFAGGVLFMIGITERTDPVYARESRELEFNEGIPWARRSPGSDGLTFKVGVTALGF